MILKLYAFLFAEFFQIGLFSFGGGYATLPFLYEIADSHHWYSINQLTQMLAVSSITPGPIGVNMATFAGFSTSGIVGALIATFGIVLPSFIIVTIISKILEKFKTNLYVKSVVYSLKPAGCALLTAVGLKLLFTSGLYLSGSIVFIILIITSIKKKLDPIFYLGVSGVIGIIFGYLNLIGV